MKSPYPSFFRSLCLALALVCGVSQAFAQDGPAEIRYRIRSINFIIDGNTRKSALRRVSELREGIEFVDEEQLAAYLKDRQQVLVNERVLESAEVTYRIAPAGEDGVFPVDVTVRVKDSWNLIALPKPSYNSNDGFELALKAREYNFLGTMEPIKFDLLFNYDENMQASLGVGTELSYPFAFLGKQWSWDLDQTLTFPTDAFDKPSENLSTSLSVQLPISDWFTLTVLGTQGYIANARDDDGEIIDDWYLEEGLTAYTTFYLYGGEEGLKFTPYFGYDANTRPGGVVSEDNQASYFSLGYTIAGGRQDWIGNQRRGTTYQFQESLYYHTYEMDWSHALDIDCRLYMTHPPFGFTSRLAGFWAINDIRESVGGYMRGILDDRLDGEAALFLNLDLPTSLVFFKPSKWFGIKWLKLFNFEGQASPFLDLGVVKPDSSTPISYDTFWYSGGFELIGFPEIARNFYVRLSFGYDLQAVLENHSFSERSRRDNSSIQEFDFGLGFSY